MRRWRALWVMAACLALTARCRKAENAPDKGNDEQGNDRTGSHDEEEPGVYDADLADHIVGTWLCAEGESFETWVFRADGTTLLRE